MINNNQATGNGGGIFATGITATLDTVHVRGNEANGAGGGLYLDFGADFTMTEDSPCDRNKVPVDRFCSEVVGNFALGSGGGVHVASSTFRARRTGFVGNESQFGAALAAAGSSEVDLRATTVLGHDVAGSGNGAITLGDTSDALVVATTAADGTGPWMDIDGAATATIRRSLVTTELDDPATTNGGCNMQAPGATGTPGAVTAPPRFGTTGYSTFVPRASSAAVDACTKMSSPNDVFGSSPRDGDGYSSGREYDRGAFETPRGFGVSCFGRTATHVGTDGNDNLVGTSGADVIVALGGNDIVDGMAGKDRICGDDGNDVLVGGDANDRISGGDGRDNAYGGNGADDLRGDGDNDRLIGNGANDKFRGGSGGNDRCLGGSGNGDVHVSGCETVKGIP